MISKKLIPPEQYMGNVTDKELKRNCFGYTEMCASFYLATSWKVSGKKRHLNLSCIVQIVFG